jgi:hypothetical protein
VQYKKYSEHNLRSNKIILFQKCIVVDTVSGYGTSQHTIESDYTHVIYRYAYGITVELLMVREIAIVTNAFFLQDHFNPGDLLNLIRAEMKFLRNYESVSYKHVWQPDG